MTKTTMIAARALAVLALATSAYAQSACRISDITIKQNDWRIDSDGDVRLVGEIINNCSQAVGVELEHVARDADGKVVAHTTHWPASIRNIDGNGGSQAVGYHIVIPPGMTVKTVTSCVISVTQWKPR